MQSYRELIVWQKSMGLVKEIYALVKLFPKEETYALSDQMRRAVVSIPSNIAEGHSRNSCKEYVQFLYIARGSKAELETQLLVAASLGYISNNQAESVLNTCAEIGKMLNSLLKKLTSNP